MGKLPGKWMKTLIFGKKSSRSKGRKENYELKKKEDKEIPVSLDQKTKLKTEKNPKPDNSQDDVSISAITESNGQKDSNRIREEQAAIDLQAALRGYLARRALQTRKGIIRLQALIRGHLVRRQAISTMYCMFQIVKFQALVRGRKVRNSHIGAQVWKSNNRLNRLNICSVGDNTSMQLLKLSSNGFAQKILASSPTPKPLHFQYESDHANSVLSWLERWSASRCWQLPPKPISGESPKPQKPHTRRSSVANVENIASELDKPIRHLRKISLDKPVNCVEEDPEVVLERVKRNLRKVNGSVLQSTNEVVQKMILEPEKLEANEKEDEGVNEQKKSRRAVWVAVKRESVENNEPLQIKRSVPGYMAPTVSAKAKLRSQDGPENANGLSRRHSLPSWTNDDISVSPLGKTSGKLMNDRSLHLSRDSNVSVKVSKPEWRR